MADALTLLEENELQQHEIVIENGMKVFQQVGMALLAIRDKKLYRGEYVTFEDYCAKRWQLKERRAYQLMDAAAIVDHLKAEPMVQLLENERQARAISKYDPDLHPVILRVSAAQAEALKIPFSAGLIERTGEVVTNAIMTGCVDTGDGKSTPFTAALTSAQEEAIKRQLQYIHENGSSKGMKPKVSRAGDEYISRGYDACQTPAYALNPLLPYLQSFRRIWECAAGEHNLVDAFYDAGWLQGEIIASDLLTGQNFFEYEPSGIQAIVTNPPYSIKYKWLERCYELGKPFALLVPVEILGAKSAQDLLKRFEFEIMLLDRRVNFKMPEKGYDGGGAQFPVLWLCSKILPEKVMFGSIVYSAGENDDFH